MSSPSERRSSEFREYLKAVDAKELDDIISASFDELEKRYLYVASEDEKTIYLLSFMKLRSRAFWLYSKVMKALMDPSTYTPGRSN